MCLFPWTASIHPDTGKAVSDPDGTLTLKCGKCHECISLRAFHWATRCKHELSEHGGSCFLTLSYNDDNLESHILEKKPFQDFMKRLRDKLHPQKIKYIASHEYGGKSGRPHHHAIIFGYNPDNQKFLQKTPSGHNLYTSPELDSLWDYGFHSIGEANVKTAYYIASYALKNKPHDITSPDGEILSLSDSMTCSHEIGLSYLMKNARQLVDSGNSLPRYYTTKMRDGHWKNGVLIWRRLDLFEEYENQFAKIKPKNISTRKQLASLTINNQQINMSSHEIRMTAPELRNFTNLKSYLRDVIKHEENQ